MDDEPPRVAETHDLCSLDKLSPEIIEDCFERRFKKDLYYTYVGDVLVAINPCKTLPIYGDEHHQRYKTLRSKSKQPPHIYWIADHVFREVTESCKPRCIIVSGVSGAGKTESTKHLLKHVLRQGSSNLNSLIENLEKVNPLLEQFGNARTSLNPNSSRFGKLVELHYHGSTLDSATIKTYTLEKARVIRQHANEKNFHIFYTLLNGFSEEKLVRYRLNDKKFRILPCESSGDDKHQGQKDLHSVVSTLKHIGCTDKNVEDVFRMLSAVLLICNIKFKEGEHDGFVDMDQTHITSVCDLLGIRDRGDFSKCMVRNTSYTNYGEKIIKAKNVVEAEDGRDALAKYVYCCLFDGIVRLINRSFRPGGPPQTRDGQQRVSLGMLDISGFENLKSDNGYEQLFINLTNEKLHKLFLENIFYKEKEDYRAEGLQFKDVQFTSNDDVLNLLTKRHGVILILEEFNKFPRTTDADYVHEMDKQCSPCKRYVQNKSSQTKFGIVHYAGQVVYDADGFLDKNMHTLSSSMKHCIWNSNISFLKSAEVEHETISRAQSFRERNKSGRKECQNNKLQDFESREYMKSLEKLNRRLHRMSPFFVRCIKPNPDLKTGEFDTNYVKSQLRSSSVLEVAEIRKDGYPVRIEYEKLLQGFLELVENIDPNLGNEEKVQTILQRVKRSNFKMGKTKVFMKDDGFDKLKEMLKEKRENEENERKRKEKEQLELTTSYVCDEAYSSMSSTPRLSTHASLPTIETVEEMEVSNTVKEEKEEKKEKEETIKKLEAKETDFESDQYANRKAYDMFRETPPRKHNGNSEMIEKVFLRFCRLLLYLVLFSTVLGSAVLVKLGVLALVAGSQTKESRLESANNLMICVIFPASITLLVSLVKIMFGRVKTLKMKYLLPVLLSAAMQTAGVGIMLFKVLPHLDAFRRIVVMMCVGIVPSFLALFERIFYSKGKCHKRLLLFAFAFISAGTQVAGVLLIYLNETDYKQNVYRWLLPFSCFLISFGWWENFIQGHVSVCSFQIDLNAVRQGLRKSRDKANVVAMFVRITVIILCTKFLVEDHSFIFTKQENTNQAHIGTTVPNLNYTSTQYPNTTQGNSSTAMNVTEPNTTNDEVVDLELRNPDKEPVQCIVLKTIMISNLSVSVNCLEHGHVSNFVCEVVDGHYKKCIQSDPITTTPSQPISWFESGMVDVYYFYRDHSSLFHIAFFSIIFSYSATLACKLKMQLFAFSLAVVLVPPFTSVIIYLKCAKLMPDIKVIPEVLQCPAMDLQSLKPAIMVESLLIGSFLLLTWYIWVPQCERMAKIPSMFVEPLKECVFLDLNMLLRRHNDTKPLPKVRQGERDDLKENDERDAPDTIYANSSKTASKQTPKLYICATMWHETRREMMQLLQSLFRLDKYCSTSKLTEDKFHTKNPDRFEPEIHVIFDDAFQIDKDTKQKVLNEYVIQLVQCIYAAAKIISGDRKWDTQPTKSNHPYGGRLTWTMPGSTKMVVHLKDKLKIRNRKRWSQIMYMYYLLGFKTFGYDVSETALKPQIKGSKRKSNSLLDNLPTEKRHELDYTFILTLDGDVDFQPEAVLLLMDRMKKNTKVGAVCGRIHPIGSGPMVWYQTFEYAVGHWLQKAAEHVLGCVLCCPGCFSLFRASALIDNNVIKTYTTKPTEPIHYIQFEQGEDRWLCTLLLQRGYKIDYCAGADALTFAPESFDDFFVQRRRWAPSTMANIMDLLGSWRETIKVNDNISILYIVYQLVMLISSLLAPATVTLMIAGSYSSVLSISDTYSYMIAIGPVAAYIYICLKCAPDLQLKSGALLSALYTIVMVVVTVGTILNIVNDDILSPNVLFLVGLGIIFVSAGLWHPKEIGCLFSGILYYLTVPSTFIFLTIYFLCNLNNVSWGTREGPKKEENGMQKKETTLLQDLREFIKRKLRQQSRNNEDTKDTIPDEVPKIIVEERKFVSQKSVVIDGMYWMSSEFLGKGNVDDSEVENEFWDNIINLYLKPLTADKDHSEKIKRIAEELIELRNNVVFGFFLINFMFSVALLQLQLNREKLLAFYILGKYEPVSVIFLSIFSTLLVVQFISMLFHRWGTFQHLISSTSLKVCCNRVLSDKDQFKEYFNEGITLLEPDYDVDDDRTYTNDDIRTMKSNSDSEYDTLNLERNDRAHNAYADDFRRNFNTTKRHYTKNEHSRYSNDRAHLLNHHGHSQWTNRDHHRQELYRRSVGRSYGRNMSSIEH